MLERHKRTEQVPFYGIYLLKTHPCSGGIHQ